MTAEPSHPASEPEARPASSGPADPATPFADGTVAEASGLAGPPPAIPTAAADRPHDTIAAPHPGAPPLAQRPPAPPPPPGWTRPPSGSPVSAAAAAAAADKASRADRRHARHRLGIEPPARIGLANRQPVFVTLNDISVGGCCVVRKGQLELSSGDLVVVELWTRDIEAKLSIHARVCWCSHQETSSRAGLRFIETNHRLLRQIEAYVQHFQRPPDPSRPQPRLPAPTPAAEPRPRSPRAERPAAPGVPGRPRGGQPVGLGSAAGGDLNAMPRPPRLTSLDLQRRMRPAHRHEVARIAEQTGIHIHTLYGWLRTLRLEGDVGAEHPRDPEAWSATDKFSALLQSIGLDRAERAAYCSRLGISEEQLERWRQAALQANEKPLLILRAEEELQRLRVSDQRDIRRLQKELRRRERSAAISEELLQVVRKLQTLWEQSDQTP